jgi:hypothetical protein
MADLLTWLEFNMNLLGPRGAQLTSLTQQVYFRDGKWRMGLGWEMQHHGSGANRGNYWNKDGGTNGFTSSLAFTQQRTSGVVILANAAWASAEELTKEVLTILESPGR